MQELLSVNVGTVQEICHPGGVVRTAIWKSAVDGEVFVGKLGVEGDAQANAAHHGGIDQAVYVYDQSNYQYWASTLGRTDFVYGQFGENFTVRGFSERTVGIGDVLQIGDVTVQVSQPRTPCFKLGLRMDDPTFIKAFTQSCRIGYYLRVLEEGVVSQGATIQMVQPASPHVSVMDVFRWMHLDTTDYHRARMAWELDGLSKEWRARFRKRWEDRPA